MKFITLISCFLVILTFVNTSELTTDCDNPCTACQRAAYQLKFQQLADCGSNHCRNTCFKVKELWNNSPDHVFKPFEKDVFGKCEICFRAGFCSIEQCKAQQDMELEIISQVVNQAKLTSKKKDYIGQVAFKDFHEDPLFYDPAKLEEFTQDLNAEKTKIDNHLNAALAKGEAGSAIKEVNKVMGTLFKKDATFSGKSVDAMKKEAKAKTEDISEEKEKVSEFVEANNKYVKHVEKIIALKKNLPKDDKADAGKLNKIVEKTVKDLDQKLHDNKVVLQEAKKSKLKVVKHAVKSAISELSKLKKNLTA
jgi:hypothetical protein